MHKFLSLLALVFFLVSCGLLVKLHDSTNDRLLGFAEELALLKQEAKPSAAQEVRRQVIEKKVELAVSDRNTGQWLLIVVAAISANVRSKKRKCSNHVGKCGTSFSGAIGNGRQTAWILNFCQLQSECGTHRPTVRLAKRIRYCYQGTQVGCGPAMPCRRPQECTRQWIPSACQQVARWRG